MVGEAADGRVALAQVRRLRPRVLLLDVTLPGLNGLLVARRVCRAFPRLRVVMLSMHNDPRIIAEAWRAGAAAYVLKDGGAHELVGAIRAVVAGERYVSPSVAAAVQAQSGDAAVPLPPCGWERLTAREREVLQLLAEGQSTRQVAATLRVSVKTAAAHRHHLMHKLGLHRVAEITRLVVRDGIGPLG